MNFLPAIPQVAQQSYGQGYGNWQQYAGFSKDKPYGSTGDLLPRKPTSTAAVPAPVTDLSTQSNTPANPAVDYSLAPSSNATMGASLSGSSNGLNASNVSAEIMNAFGVSQ